MKIFVASDNPVKINAITTAASETYPDVEVIGMSVKSGVSEQPIGEEETLSGSINRAQALKVLAKKKKLYQSSELVLFVGAEGGVYHPDFAKSDQELWSTVWISVIDQEGQIYSASGARFRLPQILADGILAGQELGHVIGELMGDLNQKRKAGAIGIITNGFIDRTEEYVGIAKLALGLWYGRHWQNKLSYNPKIKRS